jgi:hypothetical protein
MCVMATAAAAANPPLVVSGAWVRALGGAAPAAGYFTLSNTSGKVRVLDGASSPDCSALTMHQSRTIDGVSSMIGVARRAVPPHEQIIFAPGGYHLMCMSPSKAVRPGHWIPIALRFADGERLRVRFAVRPLGR